MAEATKIGPEDTPTRPKGMSDAEWVKELRMNQAAKVWNADRRSQVGRDRIEMGEEIEIQQSPRAMQGGKGQTKEDAREQWFRDWSTNRKSAATPLFKEGEDTYDFEGKGGYTYRVRPQPPDGPEDDGPLYLPPGIEIIKGPQGVGARFGSSRPVRYDSQGRDMARIDSEQGNPYSMEEGGRNEMGGEYPRWDSIPEPGVHPEYASILEELDEYLLHREGAGDRAEVAEKGYLDITED